ncbi:hypothetical protein FIBSPDRAFT_322911 [Athelia psychrophila]|uniref:Uncharacterized protein n=1 Tax=Athelia psychrophila TaxID=1759441 RepID=A0A167WRU0_9AGAM|nr:hypothetical protein FIBSPDRAFT_322911 [Fibularhizoctonia sp. CBS 109695]
MLLQTDGLHANFVLLVLDHVRALGDLPEPSESQKLTHLFVLTIDGNKVLESAKVPRESLRWKEQQEFHFTPSSNIDIAIHRKSRAFGWRKPVRVTEYSGRGADFLDTGAEQKLVAKSGTSSLIVKFDLVAESHANFLKTVTEEMSQLAKFRGADAAQSATTIGSKMGTALTALVPVIDKFAGAHPLLNVAWTVLSSAYKVAQNQIAQDASVLDLIESMREMAGAASSCPDLLKIDGTTDVIEDIGRASIDVARLVHDFVQPSIGGKAKFLARTVMNPLSGIPARIAASKQQCEDLTKKLGLRTVIDTNARMKHVQHSLETRSLNGSIPQTPILRQITMRHRRCIWRGRVLGFLTEQNSHSGRKSRARCSGSKAVREVERRSYPHLPSRKSWPSVMRNPWSEAAHPFTSMQETRSCRIWLTKRSLDHSSPSCLTDAVTKYPPPW